MSAAKATTDHDTIRAWTDKRDGTPATVKGTREDGEHAGLLRIDFPGYSGEESLTPVSWDDFFDKFEESNLAFLYQEEVDGKVSRFCKFVGRDSVKDQLDS